MSISKRTVTFILSALITSSILVTLAQAQPSASPRIFYSDLESGPNSGGQSGQGALVTVYGKSFGVTQGRSVVTVGGVAAYKYLAWSDTKVSFQVASGAVTGNIVVNVAGTSSNGAPFAIRSGHIYFVSTTGVDSQAGSYSKPWKTLAKAKNTMAAGDIVYAMNGVAATGLDNSSASLAITRAGSGGNPMAIVAYPGSTVTVGSATGQTYGVRAPSSGHSYWVLAGLTLRGASEAVDVAGASNWRLVANDISCPNGRGTAACVHASSSSQIKLLGNNVHDSGSTGAVGYESIQFSGSNTVEIGWNKIGNTRSCTAVMFSGSSSYQYGVTVHDNYIHDAVCDGINFANVDPSRGAVGAYNNVIQHVGTGPAPGGVDASYACINAGGSGSGSVLLVNNTLYDCGKRASADSGGIAASTPLIVSNNIVNVVSGETYITPNTSTSYLTGSNNLFFGVGSAPAAFSDSLNLDPLFVSATNSDFHLRSSSPASDAGTDTGVTTDYDGTPRPQGNAIDIGAFESAGTSQASASLVMDPTSLDFGSVTEGTSTTQAVLVSNTGAANATITQLQLNNASAAFSTSGLNLPITLTPGQTTSFAVTYAPQTAGTSTSTVSLISNATNSTVTLSLAGAAAIRTGTLTTSASSLSFGNVVVGSSSTQNVTVTANNKSVTISQANVTGSGFSVSGLTLPATLAAGQSATLQVKFAPAATGTITGGLSLVSNASNTPTAATLSGSGVTSTSTAGPYSIWSASTLPTNVDDGDGSSVEVGVKFTSDLSGYITGVRFFKSAANTGTHVGHLWTSSGTLLASATFTGESASGWQQVNFASPVAVTAGTVYEASYFAPNGHYSDDEGYFATAGHDNAPLHALKDGVSGVNGAYMYGSNGGFPNQGWNSSNYWVDAVFTTTGSSTAKGTIAASPTGLSFGNVTVGSSSTQNVTVTASTASVTISQATVTGTGFSMTGPTLPATIVAGQSAAFRVTFAPTTSGSLTGSLSLVSDASSTPAAVTLSGSGVSQTGTIAVSPTALSFGNVTVGSSSTQNLTVTASTASVTISQANVTGSWFSISGLTLPATIAAGQSATFHVVFAPTTAGSLTGSLSLVSNASNTPAAVTLNGSGVAGTAPSHAVALNWTASTSSNVAGYNVYRGTQSAGPFTKVTGSVVAGTTYTDSSVVAGTTYYYEATAVSTSGTESASTASVSAVVPTP